MKHIIMMIVNTYQIFICEGNLNTSYILIHGNHQQPYAVILLLPWSWLDWVISSKEVQLTKLENCRVWFELRLWSVYLYDMCVFIYIHNICNKTFICVCLSRVCSLHMVLCFINFEHIIHHTCILSPSFLTLPSPISLLCSLTQSHFYFYVIYTWSYLCV